MKKIILVAILLCPSAFAGQYLSTFSAVRAQARAKLNVSSSSAYLTDSTANQYIREGIIFINPMVMYDKEVKTFTSTFKQNTYSLDTMMIGVISVEFSKNDSVKTLKYVPRDMWFDQYPRSTVGEKGWEKFPAFFDYSDDQIFIYPTPTRVGDTMKIYGWQRVGDIDTVSTLAKLPEAYRIAVMWYVIKEAAKARTDPRTASFEQSFAEAVAVVNSGLNRREVKSAAPTGN